MQAGREKGALGLVLGWMDAGQLSMWPWSATLAAKHVQACVL